MNDGKLMYGIYLIFIEVLRDRKFSWARDRWKRVPRYV